MTPTTRVTSSTDPLLTFKCTSDGAPTAITWSYSNHLRIYTDDGEHRVVQSLSNGETSTYKSSLTFTSHPYPNDTGERVCIATAKFVSANSSETNTSTRIGKNKIITRIMHYLKMFVGASHFGMYAVGEEVNVNCVDTSKTADRVEWLNSTETVLIFSLSSTVTLNINMITDEHHGRIYTCRIRSSGVEHDINYYIIALREYILFHTR